MDVDGFLKEWALTFIKYRDAIKKEIEDINKGKEFDYVVNYKEKEAFFLIRGFLEDTGSLFELLDSREDSVLNVILINSKQNFKFLVDNWSKLAEYKSLRIYFVNPFSENDRYWIIRPYVHNKICDEESLEEGLKALFESVDEIDEKELKKKIKQNDYK